jgi:hypothetical protein
MPDPTTQCAEHRARLEAIDRRLTVLETVIGTTADDGLRGLMARLNEQLTTLNTSVQSLQLAQAQARGAVDGASWAGRILWAVLGGALSAGAVKLLGS